MLKQYVCFEEKKDEHEVKIYISAACPLGMVHDALFKARSYIIERINDAMKQDTPKDPEIKSE